MKGLRVIMNNIFNRRVLITKYESKVSVMLSWCEEGKDIIQDMESKSFSFTNPETFNKVEDVINGLVRSWGRIFIGGFYMSTISQPLDDNPKRFDWIIEHAGEDGDIFIQAVEGL